MYGDMPKQVRVRRKNGEPDVVGVMINEGPLTYRVLVTQPYRQQGRIFEIRHEEIESVVEISDESTE
jgi:hypothetical protein